MNTFKYGGLWAMHIKLSLNTNVNTGAALALIDVGTLSLSSIKLKDKILCRGKL